MSASADLRFPLEGVPLAHRVRPPAPGANPPGVRPPLLVLLHGVRSHEGAVHPLSEAFDPRLWVVSVRSPLTLSPGQFGWFTVEFTMDGPKINEPEARAAWTRVPELLAQVVAATGADPARVYLGGFSQGGIVSLATLLTAPEAVAGVVVMSGRLLPEVLPHAVAPARLAGKPVLWVHGTEDAVLPIGYQQDGVATLQRWPLAIEARQFAMPHTVAPPARDAVASWLTARLDA